MSGLQVRDLWDSTHRGPEGHGHVRVQRGMDWLTAYRVVIDCECRRVTAYTQDGTRVTIQGDKHDVLPHIVYNSRCHVKLMGWLASLTLEDEARQDLDRPRVVCEYEDVFLDELP